MAAPLRRCDECGKRRVNVTVVVVGRDLRDLCPACLPPLPISANIDRQWDPTHRDPLFAFERDGDDTAGTPEHNLHVDALDDRPHPSGDDRYGIWATTARARWLIATTSITGIGPTLLALHEEGQIDDASRVGIRDRETGMWLVKAEV